MKNCKTCEYFEEEWLYCFRLGCHVLCDDPACQHYVKKKKTI